MYLSTVPIQTISQMKNWLCLRDDMKMVTTSRLIHDTIPG